MTSFEFSDHSDESFFASVVSGQTNRHPFTNEPVALRTTQSQNPPRTGLTAYTVSELMQGMGTYKPSGIAYDAFNQTISGDLGHFIDSEGSVASVMGARAPLLAQDIASGRRGFDDGVFTAESGIAAGMLGAAGLAEQGNTRPNRRPVISGDIDPNSTPMDYGLSNGDIPEEYMVKLGIPENDTLPGAITEHMLWEPAAIAFLDMMDAMESDTGGALNRNMIGETYRTLEKQQYFYNCMITKSCNNGNTAAVPGTSNHGWGMAIDFSAAGTWIKANGPDFNWWWGDAPNEDWHFTWNRAGI